MINSVLRFLKSLRSLTQSGVIKSMDEAMDFAKREFGEVNDLLKRQIEQIFKRPQGKTPKPGEGGITSIKNAPKKKDETAQASGTSPLIQRLEKGIETLKTMKQPGMDLTVGLTRTAVRKILDRAGIQVPDKADPIDFFVQEFGADALMDVKNVAEEMIEIESMGKATKSIDEILEQTGMFNIKRDPNAPKGISNEELERIKKEVDQEKLLKDFDTTDRTENSKGGLNTLMASNDMNERLLEKLYEDFLEQGFSPEEAARKAREAFSERSNAAMGGRIGYKIGSGKSLIKFLKGKDNLVKKIKQSVDDIFTTDDPKYDADVAVDNMFEELGVDRDMFDQKEVLDAYGLAYDELKKPILEKLQKNRSFKGTEIKDKTFDENLPFDNDAEKLAEIKMSNEAYDMAPKMAERFELKQKYPGLDDDILTAIIDDPDPNNKAQVLATLEQLMELQRQGKTPEEAVDIIKKTMFTSRRDNSKGGLQYLMGL
jgi:hypothetical protein